MDENRRKALSKRSSRDMYVLLFGDDNSDEFCTLKAIFMPLYVLYYLVSIEISTVMLSRVEALVVNIYVLVLLMSFINQFIKFGAYLAWLVKSFVVKVLQR